MLHAQLIETNGAVSLVITNTTSGKSTILPQVTAMNLGEAQTAFKTYLDAVKRSRMLERTFEGEFTTGKLKDSDEAREENVKGNRERMQQHLSIIYLPHELPVVRGALARIQAECQELLGPSVFTRVMNARRNVPKLAEELLVGFGPSVSATVELTSELPGVSVPENQFTEASVATA